MPATLISKGSVKGMANVDNRSRLPTRLVPGIVNTNVTLTVRGDPDLKRQQQMQEARNEKLKLIYSLPGKYRLVSSEEYMEQKCQETELEDQ
jgi:hypothetical protein